MGGSVDVKSKIGQGSEFIINMKTFCKVKDIELTSPRVEKEKKPNNVLESFSRAQKPIVFLEKPGESEELTSCIKDFIDTNIKEGNKDFEQQINELGEDDQ